MATFLIADITGGYGLLVPLLTASAVTYLCISPFERHSRGTQNSNGTNELNRVNNGYFPD